MLAAGSLTAMCNILQHFFVVVVCLLIVRVNTAVMGLGCDGPSRFDPIVLDSPLLGRANMSDSAWHDDTWAFRRYGPISRLTLYKAWFYDGVWHNPGEFKGIQTWHGKYYTTDDQLLFGAKRPHIPLNCTLYRDEVIVRAEVQWDHVMRFMNFTTNRGRYCSWGFPNVEGATIAVSLPPGPDTYIAALRGYEGKPLPPSQGGFRKRYIVQIGFVWARMRCNNGTRAATQNAVNIATTAFAATRTGAPVKTTTARSGVQAGLTGVPTTAAVSPIAPKANKSITTLPA